MSGRQAVVTVLPPTVEVKPTEGAEVAAEAATPEGAAAAAPAEGAAGAKKGGGEG